MLICGLKITHDGGVAIIDNGRLVGSFEVEKFDNRHRYAELDDLALVERVLGSQDIELGDVDLFAVDGWGYGEPDPVVGTSHRGVAVRLAVAPYRESQVSDDSLAAYRFDGLPLGRKEFPYDSFHHTTGHILSAYCASPFAAAGEPSYVVVWDGGVLPRGYYVRPDGRHIENLGPIFGLIGNVYPWFAMHFPPFRPQDLGGPPDRVRYHQLSVPGKVMAYTALGEVRDDLCRVFDDIYADELVISMDFAGALAKSFLARTAGSALRPADALASFQHWLGVQLVRSISEMRELSPGYAGNLCFSGGCALNIKWNAEIRASGVFDRFFVPPFPNDSGAALGAACAAMVSRTGNIALDWSVYSGPVLGVADGAVDGYRPRPCSVTQLARLLHESGEAVVVLHGRAELGPRALGNRSILMSATDGANKDRLNTMKRRESYRPVSPICLTSRAPAIFEPGVPDPYMLFEHRVRPEWTSRIPAVIHLDGTARLQTVDHRYNPVIGELLTEYERCSGIPVLCNTSANLNGCGFFPDVESALRWGGAPYVWSDGRLWERLPGGREAGQPREGIDGDS